jgi:hypothetical protein
METWAFNEPDEVVEYARVGDHDARDESILQVIQLSLSALACK